MIEINENIKLETWDEKHISGLLKHADSKKISQYLSESFPSPYTYQAAVDWVNFNKEIKEDYNFAIVYNDECIGGIGLIPKSDIYIKTIEIGFWLSTHYQNRGIMSSIIPSMLKYTFENFDINRIEALIFSNNDSSKKVIEKNNFTKEAVLKEAIFKNNEFLDLHLYRLLKTEFLLNDKTRKS